MPERGTLSDTYVAAIQHEMVDLPPEAYRVGVVRRPTRWLHPHVDENVRALGPPADLLDDFQARHEELKRRGLCDEEAHNAAWKAVDYGDRYRSYLDDSTAARDALESLRARLETGDDVVLVCYENTANKRCHRTLLRDRLAVRLADGPD